MTSALIAAGKNRMSLSLGTNNFVTFNECICVFLFYGQYFYTLHFTLVDFFDLLFAMTLHFGFMGGLYYYLTVYQGPVSATQQMVCRCAFIIPISKLYVVVHLLSR